VKAHLVLTIIADDRPGIVKALSDTVRAHDGSWMESSMTRLGGKFAGILRVEVAAQKQEELVAALNNLQETGIRVSAETSDQPGDSEVHTVSIRLVGNERPGIIEEISVILAERKVNVEELSTRVASAPWSAEELFHAEILAGLPPEMNLEELQSALEGLSDDLTVEISNAATTP
jgi:glycine cleavage system regulatory protein